MYVWVSHPAASEGGALLLALSIVFGICSFQMRWSPRVVLWMIMGRLVASEGVAKAMAFEVS